MLKFQPSADISFCLGSEHCDNAELTEPPRQIVIEVRTLLRRLRSNDGLGNVQVDPTDWHSYYSLSDQYSNCFPAYQRLCFCLYYLSIHLCLNSVAVESE